MVEVIWTEPALADIDRIADYISLADPAAARSLVQRAFHATDKLAKFPKLGPCPRELIGTGYRHIIVAPLRIFYRLEQQAAYVIHVRRSEQRFSLSDLEARESE